MCVRIRFCIEALWESEKQRPFQVLERPGNSDWGAQMYEQQNAASKRWRPLFCPLVLIACAKTLTIEDLCEGGSWLQQLQLLIASARNHLARR